MMNQQIFIIDQREFCAVSSANLTNPQERMHFSIPGGPAVRIQSPELI
jgi:hypothetical protein